MEAIWLAFALFMLVEGLGPMLFPNKWQDYLRQLAAQPPEQMRTIGGVMVTVGAVTLLFLL